jgi:hypothetical protein
VYVIGLEQALYFELSSEHRNVACAVASLKLKLAEVCRVGFAGCEVITGVATVGLPEAATATTAAASSEASAARSSQSLVVVCRACAILIPLPGPLVWMLGLLSSSWSYVPRSVG